MCFNDEEIKFNVTNAMKFPVDEEISSAIQSLSWDYCEEEAYIKLFSPKEFFEEEDPEYLVEEVNNMSDKKKFESLNL